MNMIAMPGKSEVTVVPHGKETTHIYLGQMLGCEVRGLTEPVTEVVWTKDESDVTTLAEGKTAMLLFFIIADSVT